MADPINYCSWFYSSFCITQSEWAAWTQAGMSVAAIVFAARLASTQERRLLSRRAYAIAYLIEEADDQCFSALAGYRTKGQLKDAVLPFGHPLQTALDELKQTRDALKSVVLHDLPDNRLQPLVNTALRCCEHAISLIDTPATTADPSSPDITRKLNEVVRQTQVAREKAIPVTASFVTLRTKLHQRFGYWRSARRYRSHAASEKS